MPLKIMVPLDRVQQALNSSLVLDHPQRCSRCGTVPADHYETHSLRLRIGQKRPGLYGQTYRFNKPYRLRISICQACYRADFVTSSEEQEKDETATGRLARIYSRLYTVGGVIAAGQVMMDIVPVSDMLVVLATIDPLDIDQVRPDMAAQVWLSALNRRTDRPLDGRVITVSADRLTDPATGAPFYQARVQLDPASLQGQTIPIQAGMVAEVMIRTAERTTWDYIMSPITQFLQSSLREG